MRKEKVEYVNKFGTKVEKYIPVHHHVGKKVAKHELKRAEEIIKIDKARLKHAEKQVEKAKKMYG